MMIFMGSGRALAADRRARRVRALVACARACGEVSRLGLDAARRGDVELAGTAAAAVGCREFCDLAASLLSRRSAMIRHALPGCAEACRRCADACEQRTDMPILQECARMCRECEALCRTLSGSMS